MIDVAARIAADRQAWSWSRSCELTFDLHVQGKALTVNGVGFGNLRAHSQ